MRAALLLLILFAGTARADMSFRRLAIPEDVPADLCTALVQDGEGFLWMGTQRGAVRYDGTSFRVHLGGLYVRTLLAARDGRVWAGTFGGGASVYDPQTEAFTHYRQKDGLSHDRVEGLAEDGDGRIWIGTSEGLDRLDPKTRKIEHFRHDPRNANSLAHDRVRGLLVDRAGRLWVGTRDGLQRFLGDGRGFERIAPELAGQLVSKLYEDNRGRIWIGTAEHGAAVLDTRGGTLRWLEALSHFWIYGFEQAGPRELWIATFGGGIDVVDPETLAVVERLKHDATLENTIGGDRIGALLRDRSGVMWVGTWGQGVARHDPATRAFRTVRHSPNRPEGLSHRAAVRAMEMDDGRIWVGTNGNGIDILDRDLQRIGGYGVDALASGAVTCLAQGADGTIWVATLDGTLHRLPRGATTFERLTTKDGLPGGPIRALTFGPGGELWAGASEGVARIDWEGGSSGSSGSSVPRGSESAVPDSRGTRGTPRNPRNSQAVITAYRHNRNDPRSLSSNAAEAIAIGRDGTVWVGTDAGLNALDPARGTFVRITEGLPNPWVPDLMVARDGRLWVATNGGAAILTSWDGKQARFEHVAPRIGRAAGPVEALIEDASGAVWLGPRLRVDPRTWQSRELGPSDGADFRNFFIASRARTRSGALLFGAPEGLLVIQPERIAPWTYAPPVVASAVRVDGVARAGAPRKRTIVLSPHERGFTLDFAALDYTAPGRNLYRHRLEGFDERWIHATGAQPSLTYTNLSPGTYTLRVQATNRAGVWSPHELRMRVVVQPAFYETGWFRATMVLLALALAYGAYRLRLRRLHARERHLERLVATRTSELADAYARIELASLTDPLTKLHNRRYLEQSIDADVELARRGQGDLVFLLVDLDHFKSVNDTWGHAAGDAVLIQTAGVLRATFRASDHLVRWGGEEFLIVARFIDRRSGPELAEKLRAAIAAHEFTLPDGTTLRRTCSIGFAAFPFGEASWEQVVDLADGALYKAKRGGRDQARAA